MCEGSCPRQLVGPPPARVTPARQVDGCEHTVHGTPDLERDLGAPPLRRARFRPPGAGGHRLARRASLSCSLCQSGRGRDRPPHRARRAERRARRTIARRRPSMPCGLGRGRARRLGRGRARRLGRGGPIRHPRPRSYRQAASCRCPVATVATDPGVLHRARTIALPARNPPQRCWHGGEDTARGDLAHASCPRREDAAARSFSKFLVSSTRFFVTVGAEEVTGPDLEEAVPGP